MSCTVFICEFRKTTKLSTMIAGPDGVRSAMAETNLISPSLKWMSRSYVKNDATAHEMK